VFYFKSKYDDFSLLSVGFSKNFTSNLEIELFLNEFPEAYLCAPLKFDDPLYNPPQLNDIYLGEWTFVKKNNRTTLTIFADSKTKHFSSPEIFFEPLEVSHHDITIPNWVNDELSPEFDSWEEMIVSAQNLFKTTDLKKLVLSRRRIFEYEHPLLLKSFFYNLIDNKYNSKESYQIYFQENLNNAFISLTPEKLFSLHGNKVTTIALASSAFRKQDSTEDKLEENILKESPKLISEHQIVVDDIKDSLSKICTNIYTSELKIMKLSYIQHRAVDISAEINEKYSAIDLLALLHPTSAIGGVPRNTALLNLKKIEKSNRENYASPFGVISKNFSEFAVAIRSGKIEENKITLFGGAGILPDSDAQSEWNETANKMTPFLKVINHE
jgi:menaquinone-specific isochorismate synthase